MASRVELFDVVIPAGTAIAAAITTATTFPVGEVEGIEIVVPPGPSGLVGFGIVHGGGSVYPREDGRWIVADNEVIRWAVSGAPTAGDWAVRAYNLDSYPHTLYLRYLVREISAAIGVPMAALPITQPNQPASALEDSSATPPAVPE